MFKDKDLCILLKILKSRDVGKSMKNKHGKKY